MASDSRQRKKFSVKDHRKKVWVLAVLGVMGVIVGLLPAIRYPGLVVVGVFGGTIGVIVLIGIITSPVYRRRRERLLNAVQVAHPGVPVILAAGSRATQEDARLAGVDTGNLGKTNSTLALAVLPDRIEVWVWGDPRPRWIVRRAGAEVSVESINVGNRDAGGLETPGIRVSDGERAVRFIPYYMGISRRRTVAHLEQALRDLGEDPDDHIGT